MKRIVVHQTFPAKSLFILLLIVILLYVANQAVGRVVAQENNLVPTTTAPVLGDQIRVVAFSPDGSLLLTGDDKGVTRLWDTQTAMLTKTLLDRVDYTVGSTFSADGQYIFSSQCCLARENSVVKMWDIASGQILQSFAGGVPIFSPDSKTLITSGGGMPGRLWNAITGTLLKTYDHSYNTGIFSPDGKRLLTSNFVIGQAQLWDFETETLLYTFPRVISDSLIKDDTGFVYSLAFSSNGKYALIGNGNHNLLLWDLETFTSIQALVYSGQGQVVFSPDSKQFAFANSQGNGQVVEVQTGKLVQELPSAYNNQTTGIAFSPDGQFLLTANYSSSAQLWDVQTGSQVNVYDTQALK